MMFLIIHHPAVLTQLKAGGYCESDEDDEKQQICMNMTCPQYSGEGPCPLRGASDHDTATDLQAIAEPKVIIKTMDILHTAV